VVLASADDRLPTKLSNKSTGTGPGKGSELSLSSASSAVAASNEPVDGPSPCGVKDGAFTLNIEGVLGGLIMRGAISPSIMCGV
jgi:hypothetical protein